MLADFCASEAVPSADWLAGERGKVIAAIDAGGRVPRRRPAGFGWFFWFGGFGWFRRLVVSRTAVFGVVVVAAVSALLIALVVPSVYGGSHVQIQTAAYVISQTEAALSASAAENMVVHVHTANGPGVEQDLFFNTSGHVLHAKQTDSWYYVPRDSTFPERREGFTAGSQPVYDTGIAQDPDIVVDYPARIWWRAASDIMLWPPAHGSALSCNNAGVYLFVMNNAPTYWPGDLRRLLACGKFTVSGTERVDGVDAIKVTQVRPGGMSVVLWVDPSGFLPLRVTVSEQNVRGGPYQLYRDETVQWLPPTAANLTTLTVPIPSGFVQVPAPPESCGNGSLAAVKNCDSALDAWWAMYVTPRL